MTRRLGEVFYSHPFVVTFRIDRTTTSQTEYAKRLAALESAVSVVASGVSWKEPTSCFVFESDRTVDEIAACVARAVDHSKDVVLVVRVDAGEAVVIGSDYEFGKLNAVLPRAKKLG